MTPSNGQSKSIVCLPSTIATTAACSTATTGVSLASAASKPPSSTYMASLLLLVRLLLLELRRRATAKWLLRRVWLPVCVALRRSERRVIEHRRKVVVVWSLLLLHAPMRATTRELVRRSTASICLAVRIRRKAIRRRAHARRPIHGAELVATHWRWLLLPSTSSACSHHFLWISTEVRIVLTSTSVLHLAKAIEMWRKLLLQRDSVRLRLSPLHLLVSPSLTTLVDRTLLLLSRWWPIVAGLWVLIVVALGTTACVRRRRC